MVASATVRVMSPEEITARGGGDPPFLLFAERSTLFAERAMRLRQLAVNHPMGDYLSFVADLAQAQQQQLDAGTIWPVPAADALDQAAQNGQPALPAAEGAPDAGWQAGLKAMASALLGTAPAAAQGALRRLAKADVVLLDRQADALLQGLHSGLDLGAAPIVAAALQVAWTGWVLDTQAQATAAGKAPFGRVDDLSRCPCCGSLPVASLTRSGGDFAGQRYLVCGLCSTQWQMARIRCTHCGATENLAYQSLAATGQAGEIGKDEGSRAAQSAIQAETCDDCHHYLKILHTERDPMVEAGADDLASLTLDLLVSEAGYRRHGQNLMLFFGEPPPDPPDPPDPGQA